tara:strand:+ start:1842 stop:2009 length:168 start_codon:yes stop_codon:yes gene_type:complete
MHSVESKGRSGARAASPHTGISVSEARAAEDRRARTTSFIILYGVLVIGTPRSPG